MRKLVWLCSIYPTRSNPFLGDFVERHALAASAHSQISVIHVCSNEVDPPFQQRSYHQNLTADIINLGPGTGKGYLLRQYRFIAAYMRWIRQYIRNHGKPAMIHVHNSIHGAFIARLIKLRFGIHFVITEHSSVFLPASHGWEGLGNVARAAAKMGMKSAGEISVVSQALRAGVKKLTVIEAGRRVPDVVDTSLFHYDAEVQLPPVFVHNTGPEEIKNTLRILQAIALIQEELAARSFRLMIVGAYREDITTTARRLGIDRLVEQKGEMPQQQLAGLVRCAAALIQFSSYETFGCIVAESLCAGCPVIASRIPAMEELIQKDYGLLAALHEAELAAAILEMLSVYQDFDRQKIAAENSEKFSMAVIGGQFDEWYKALGI